MVFLNRYNSRPEANVVVGLVVSKDTSTVPAAQPNGTNGERHLLRAEASGGFSANARGMNGVEQPGPDGAQGRDGSRANARVVVFRGVEERTFGLFPLQAQAVHFQQPWHMIWGLELAFFSGFEH